MILGISTALLALSVATLLVAPHTGTSTGQMALDENSISDQKERCIQVLRDLELDFTTQKISEEDYKKTRLTLEQELASILTKLSNK